MRRIRSSIAWIASRSDAIIARISKLLSLDCPGPGLFSAHPAASAIIMASPRARAVARLAARVVCVIG